MDNKISLAHRLEYLGLRCAESAINALPRRLALGLGAGLGTVLYHCRIYRAVVDKNMDYTGVPEAPIRERTIRDLYKNIGRYAMDFLRSPDRLPPHAVHNFEALEGVVARGKGAIAVLAHFGNWEVLASIFGSKINDLNIMTKPMRNPLVEKWLLAKRTKTGAAPLYFVHSLRKIVEVLGRNGVIAMLIDQYAGGQGTTAIFLGKPANTVRSVAGLLHKLDCGIIFACALLEKDGSYWTHFEEGPRLNAPPDDRDRFILAYQNAHNEVLSRWIAAHPDHYFGWFHKRFKGMIKYDG